MKYSTYLLLVLILFAVSCSGTQIDEKKEDEKVEAKDNPIVNNADVKKEEEKKPENETEPKTEKTLKVENENASAIEKKSETEKDDTEKKENDEFAPMYKYKLIETNDPLCLKFQTEHAYFEVYFSKENSILNFFEDDLKEIGKKHLMKKCIDYVETFYSRVEKWLALGNAKPAYSGVYLYLHESSNKITIPENKSIENFKDYLLLVMDLREFSRDSISRRLWFELLPIESDIIRTGLSRIQPSYKGMSIEQYYQFIPVIRMSVPNNDFFNTSSPINNEFYDLQRADFVSYMLEKAGSVDKFLDFCKDNGKFKELYGEWIKSRKLFLENDKLPENFKILYQFQKGQCKEALNKLNHMHLNNMKTQEAVFLNFAKLCFFAEQHQFIRRFLEEQVLSIDFLFNRLPKEKKAILFDQIRVPIELLFANIFTGDAEFNNKLVIYLEKIGYVLLSKFMLYSENILNEIELIRNTAKKEVADFIKTVPKSYHDEFQWWYDFMCMISELKYGFNSKAKEYLENLSKISVSRQQIQLARFAFEHNSK